MEAKVDLKRGIATYTARRGRFDVVDVAPQRFLMIDGHGDPNTSPAYRDAVATLFGTAYALKFFSKKELGRDYTVMPLEAQWWADDMASFTDARDKTMWNWTVMNLVPDGIAAEHIEEVRRRVALKGAAPSLDLLRVEEFTEGRCVQTLHVGSYDDEAPVLADLHDEVIPGLGLRMTGLHHEIYLNDARRTAPDKLRTILRQPVADA